MEETNIVEQDALRKSLKVFLGKLTAAKVVGVGGLAALCAASILIVIPGGQPASVTLLATALSSIGLNVLAGLLQQFYQKIASLPSGDEIERFQQLAQMIEDRLKDDKALQDEVGQFLGATEAISIAQEVAQGNEAVHGWLLTAIRDDVTKFGVDLVEGQVQLRKGQGDIFIALMKVLMEVRKTYDLVKQTVEQPVRSKKLTAEELETAQQLLERMPTEGELPEVAALPAGSRMVFSRNPLFVGREDDLRRLARTLKGGQTAAIGQIAATTGLGGIGKTQLASEFVHRYGQYFAGGVFWLSFAEAENILAEIATCGGLQGMGLYTKMTKLKLDDQVAMVQSAWQSALPRLLVFDNCEDEALLAQWRPSSGGCRVLVTSRRGHWSKALGVEALRLGVLERDESKALLRKHRPELGDYEVEAIAEELGDLPLALHVAGSFLATYMHTKAGSPAVYLSQLQAIGLDHPSLSRTGVTWTTEHERHVGRTFAMSYTRLEAEDTTDTLALELLVRAAYFAPGIPIPRELLRATVGIEASDETELKLEDALARLVGLGLLEVEDDGALVLHRLLTKFVLGMRADEKAQISVEEAVLAEATRLITIGYPALLTSWQPHFRVVTDAARMRGDERGANLCNRMGMYLVMFADYTGAWPYLKDTLAIREKVLGEEHPDTAISLNNLAGLNQAQGDYETAKLLYERALRILEGLLGPNHPDVASTLNNLASLLVDQGDYEAAKPLHERALAIREKVLGEEHHDTAVSLNNLARLLHAQGDYEAAKPLFDHALTIFERSSDSTHPDMAKTLSNFAELLEMQGDYGAAKLLLKRALAFFEEVFGSDHPDVAAALNNLAKLLKVQGDYEAAKPLYERALDICKKVLGEEHPYTAVTLNNLGSLLHAQGEYEAAKPHFERALTINEKSLGSNHPNTAKSLNNLAELLKVQGDYEAAKPLLERVLAIREVLLGEEHPDTAKILHNLASLHRDQGDYATAQPLFERSLVISKKVLGAKHPDVARSLHGLAGLFFEQSDYATARPLLEEALAIHIEVLGPNHPETWHFRLGLLNTIWKLRFEKQIIVTLKM